MINNSDLDINTGPIFLCDVSKQGLATRGTAGGLVKPDWGCGAKNSFVLVFFFYLKARLDIETTQGSIEGKWATHEPR